MVNIVECWGERARRGNAYTGYTEVVTVIEDVVWVVAASFANVVLVSAALTSRPAAVLRGVALKAGINCVGNKKRKDSEVG